MRPAQIQIQLDSAPREYHFPGVAMAIFPERLAARRVSLTPCPQNGVFSSEGDVNVEKLFK